MRSPLTCYEDPVEAQPRCSWGKKILCYEFLVVGTAWSPPPQCLLNTQHGSPRSSRCHMHKLPGQRYLAQGSACCFQSLELSTHSWEPPGSKRGCLGKPEIMPPNFQGVSQAAVNRILVQNGETRTYHCRDIYFFSLMTN